MFQAILRRIGAALLTLWLAATLTFFTLFLVPGDPAEAALSQSTASEDVLERRREALGLNLPLWDQYERYWIGLLHGDLGISWSAGQPVAYMIGQQIGPTAALAAAGMVVAVVVGIGLGLGASIWPGTWAAEACRRVTGFLLALPVMVAGILLIILFAVLLDVLPATGQGTPGQLILPALTVGLNAAGGIARTVDAGVSEAMTRSFVKVARAKGLTHSRVVIRHALRIGFLPVLDIIALQFGMLLGGAVVTESVFARQGIGRLLLTAVLDKDLPVVQGVVLISALVYSLLNLSADLARVWLDPRLRIEE